MKTQNFIFMLTVSAMLAAGSNVNAQPCTGEVTSFTLVHHEEEGDIGTLNNGDEVNTDCEVNIRADVTCESWIGSVEFRLNGNRYRVENVAPYALAGDNNGGYFTLHLSPGQYQLKATPWSRSNASGSQGISLSIMFTVIDEECGDQNDVVSCCDLRSDMRKLWADHIIWTRNVIFNIIDDLPGTNEAVARLLQNQVDIGDAFKPYFGNANGNTLAGYLHNHITIAAEILIAVKTGDTAAYNDANTRWYLNADSIVAFLHSINPDHWSIAEGTDMFYEHLEYTTDEVVARATGDYAGDVQNFEEVIEGAFEMSDFLTEGIVAQFPDMFSCDNGLGGGNDGYKTSGAIHEQLTNLVDNSIVLLQNVPNPFADETMIQYFIPENVSQAQILFYDGKGTLIQTVNISEKGKGRLKVFTPDLSQGVYSYSIIADGKMIDSKKMVHQN